MLTMERPTQIPMPSTNLGRPVRVSFVIDELGVAGTESQLLALIRHLDRDRVEPSLILLHGLRESSQRLEPNNCPVLRLGVEKIMGKHAFQAARKLRDYWQQCPPDVTQIYFLDSAHFAVPVARWCRVPRIIRVQNNLGYFHNRRTRILNRIVRPWVHEMLTNSEAGRTALAKQEQLPTDRVHVIENGVDWHRFAQIRPPDFQRQNLVIGTLANLRPVKNIDGFLRVAAKLLQQFPALQFRVGGEGELRNELEQLHQQLSLGSRVQFVGRVQNVPAFLGELDIAVLPSHSEGMSNALLEYMAAGRAIVATDVGANAKLIRHRRSGWIVPPRDEGALLEALQEVLTHPELASECAMAGQAHVREHLSRAVMVRRFEEFYCR